MHFIIQMSLKDYALRSYISALESIGADYSIVSYFKEDKEFSGFPENSAPLYSVSGISLLKAIQFENNFSFLNNDGDKIADSGLESRFRDSFFYKNPSNFDQKTAIEHNMPMLNKDASFIDLSIHSQASFHTDVFIKPSDDLKSFIGGILPAGQTIESFILNDSSYMPGWREGTAIVALPKQIHSEYRFFVVNKEPITGSRYFTQGKGDVSSDIPESVFKEANKLAQRFQPDDAFTMDLALMMDGSISIVEYNCINVSGHYACDLPLFLDALRQFASNK